MDIERLKKTLTKHEACVLMPYECSSGCLTIGIGRNLDDKGISQKVADIMLEEDIQDATADLEKNIEGFRELPITVQEALVNMCFNMGISRLMQFKKTLALIQEGKFVKAGNEALNSKWASQVGYRSVEVAALIKEGSECSKI